MIGSWYSLNRPTSGHNIHIHVHTQFQSLTIANLKEFRIIILDNHHQGNRLDPPMCSYRDKRGNCCYQFYHNSHKMTPSGIMSTNSTSSGSRKYISTTMGNRPKCPVWNIMKTRPNSVCSPHKIWIPTRIEKYNSFHVPPFFFLSNLYCSVHNLTGLPYTCTSEVSEMAQFLSGKTENSSESILLWHCKWEIIILGWHWAPPFIAHVNLVVEIELQNCRSHLFMMSYHFA